ncbi:sensor histidine kinase [Oligoflexus tunisiensis]|uniref:sensor histidine kinase n=1 Tax=Oligoflexus tunisiensis TaxID=708132 RepID=UPI00159F2EDE|nr:HAMP domain-containing sensor histidine kinase [Oligoflexus tunisiensis]
MDRRIIAFYTLAAIVITLIFSVMISLYGAWGLGLALLAIAGNNLPVLYLLRRRTKSRKASYYLIANGAFTMTFAMSFVGGLEGPVTYWLGLLPLAGGLLLYLRGIIYGTLLAFASVLVLSLRPYVPGVYDVLIPDMLYLVVSLCCFVTMIGFIAWFFLQKNALVVADQTRKLDHLLNIVTHDIANPLTLISGHAELLISQGHASHAHTQALHRIARASDLINEILRKVRQIQAAKAGKLRIQTCAVSLASMFDQLRFIFEARLERKKQTLRIDLPASDYDVLVQAEPVMLLNEVLNNLISNAMKFSPQGSTIHVIATREPDAMRIEVRDQGIGIPRELLPYIFDDFRSTSRPGTEGETGTGFGLPLARHIVEAFGGSLHVTSHSADETRKPTGTVFTLRLPVSQAVRYQTKAS